MAKKIAIANQKGGVGKTTTAYNLATAQAKLGKRILMIDMDQQASLVELTGHSSYDKDFVGFTTDKLFSSSVDPLDCCFAVEAMGEKMELFIVPSPGDALAVTEVSLYAKNDGLLLFRENIRKLDRYFDYIFFDCPPNLGQMLLASLISSDSVIIPCKPEELSFAGIGKLLATIDEVKKSKSDASNKNLKIIGMIATMYRSTVTEHNIIMAKMENDYKLLGVIPLSASVSKSMPVPIVAAHPSSKPAKAYMQIAYNI